jgi:small subunit ribosomal protein S9
MMAEETNDVKDTQESQDDSSQAKATATATATPPAPKSRTAPPLPEGQLWIWGTGRRKKAVARVRIRPGEGKINVNGKDVDEYFCAQRDRSAVHAPLRAAHMLKAYDVFCNVSGGGTTGQADAIKLGLARAIAKHQPDLEHDLRDKSLLTRDARMPERKKPGQPGARKHFQFSKR